MARPRRAYTTRTTGMSSGVALSSSNMITIGR
jgi:hypothetical protein